MILHVARLKMDNLAINRFPSCNEEELISKGKCLSLQSCLQKGEPVRWHTQRCQAQHINGAAAPAKNPQCIQEHELPQIYSEVEEKRQTLDEKKRRNIFSISPLSLNVAQGRLFSFLEGV